MMYINIYYSLIYNLHNVYIFVKWCLLTTEKKNKKIRLRRTYITEKQTVIDLSTFHLRGGRMGCSYIFSTTLNLALRERGLEEILLRVGTIGFLVRIFKIPSASGDGSATSTSLAIRWYFLHKNKFFFETLHFWTPSFAKTTDGTAVLTIR